MEGSGAGGRRGREAVLGGCSGSGLGPCAPDGLFLEMRFVAQEPFYLHHRLRGQLTQHLELNGVVERAVHAGLLNKGMRFENPGSRTAKPGGRERVAAVPLPHRLTLGPLICQARTL